jgi:hypothetical protein
MTTFARVHHLHHLIRVACTTSGLAVQRAPLMPLSPTERGKWCSKLVVPPSGQATKRSSATSGAKRRCATSPTLAERKPVLEAWLAAAPPQPLPRRLAALELARIARNYRINVEVGP